MNKFTINEHYSPKEAELEIAYIKCMEEIQNGTNFNDSIEEHMDRLHKELKKYGIKPRSLVTLIHNNF